MTTYEFYEQLGSRPHPMQDVKDIYPPSETIPDMDMKPATIIERCIRHLPVPIAHQETFVLTESESRDDNDEVFDNYVVGDKFDLMDYNNRVLSPKKKVKEPEPQQKEPQQKEPQQKEPQQKEPEPPKE